MLRRKVRLTGLLLAMRNRPNSGSQCLLSPSLALLALTAMPLSVTVRPSLAYKARYDNDVELYVKFTVSQFKLSTRDVSIMDWPFQTDSPP